MMMQKRWKIEPTLTLLLLLANQCILRTSNALSTPPSEKVNSRRKLLSSIASATVLVGSSSPKPTNADTPPAFGTKGGLASKLSSRDPSLLRNSVFNIPPSAQIYPPFLRGEWNVRLQFQGFLFPSQTIPKQKLLQDTSIPGFTKCSIVSLSDVGKDVVNYRMKIAPNTGLEDRAFDLRQTISAHLGNDDAVQSVQYDPKSNPNRISIVFSKYRTRNAEQIELFCNGRDSELVQSSDGRSIFVCSEYIRQVTYSLSTEFGVARQVVTNYAHFWTWREQQQQQPLNDDDRTVTGNLLTVAYLDPLNPMFFEEPSKPVVVYSHDILAKRVL